MSDYTLTKAELTKLKSRLTRAKKAGPVQVLQVTSDAFELFEHKGYPDCWSNWERARGDALSEIERSTLAGNPKYYKEMLSK